MRYIKQLAKITQSSKKLKKSLLWFYLNKIHKYIYYITHIFPSRYLTTAVLF